MNTTNQFEIQQEANRLQSAIKTFFENFSVGTLLNRAGIKKLKGYLHWQGREAGVGPN